MSKVAAYYHIVFCTKAREMTIPKEKREYMYRFIWKEIKRYAVSIPINRLSEATESLTGYPRLKPGVSTQSSALRAEKT